ncbi:hypothetical protein E3O53_03195 [Cryobacterium sp. TMT2-18-3]|uniref:hypothetical protein n=1 Tax=unclassified Cryobacterium TaxID=2649013 RepID=UPI001068E98A|nr:MULTISPECIES: hypothetical protein [unclassified Cryobacterium]TFC27637.1 hypothetical protein E3O22_09465 [Cryobacterium sp. TMT2-18-2]TFC66756.1 hypothetical protein E3O53_03195 [Cryobacterium sp. TMT2-18-3]
MAIAFSLVIPLLLLICAVRVYPILGIGFAEGNTVVLAALGLTAVVGLLAQGAPLCRPSRAGLRTAGLAAIVPAAGGLAAVLLSVGTSGRMLSWAMNSDAIWNTVTARNLFIDGGLLPGVHPNSSPLTGVLMAASFAPGRNATAATELLNHDVTRAAQLWVLAILVASFLAGLVVARSVSGQHPWLRLLATMLAGGFVTSWYVAGFSFQYGFYNVSPSIALLLLCWLLWTELPQARLWAAALLFLLTTVLLASWAPLAVAPLFLGIVGFLRYSWAELRHASLPTRAICAASVLQVPAYVGFVTLEDLRRDGGALSGGGAMAPVIPAILFILIGAVVFAGAIGTGDATSRHELVGVILISLAGLLTYGYLGWQLRDAATKWWGYYPAKFVWFLSILLVVVLLAIVLGRLSHSSTLGLNAAAGVVGILVLVGAVLGSVPPSLNRIGALVPLADIVRGLGASARDAAIPTLFTLSTPGEKNVVARYAQDPSDDYFVNGWLLQLSASSAEDPIRYHSYYLNATEPIQLCAMIDTWGGGVNVHTRDGKLQAELEEACPTSKYTVVLGDLPAPMN